MLKVRAIAVLCAVVGTACSVSDNVFTPFDAATADAQDTDAPPGAIDGGVDGPTPTTLASLAASRGTLDPPFTPGTTTYDLDLLYADATVQLTPTSAAAGVTITVDGSTVASGAASPSIALAVGSRDLDVVVSDGTRAVTTYRLHIHRGVDVLANLTVPSGAIAPAFAPAVSTYRLDLPLMQATTTFTPTAAVPSRSTITVNSATVSSGTASAAIPLAEGSLSSNRVEVTVTPASGSPHTYEVQVARGVDALSALSVSYLGGTVTTPLSPMFAPPVTSYALNVGFLLPRVQIAATGMVTTSTVTVNGATVGAGIPSAPIALAGTTTIPVRVTPAMGAGTAGDYSLAITRAAAIVATPQQLYAHAPGSDDRFGTAVDLWGDTLVVGAPLEDGGATGVGGAVDEAVTNAGAAYVFQRTGNTWSAGVYLKASTPSSGATFGRAVSVWGDTIAVGAENDDDVVADSGTVYIFTRVAGVWTPTATIKAPMPGTGDRFGGSVALHGDTLVVGASGEDSGATSVGGSQADNSRPDAGAAYVFVRTGTTWSLQSYLKASNTDADDFFGWSVAISGDVVVVGAWQEDGAATTVNGDAASNAAGDAGAAYVYRRTGTTWAPEAYLKYAQQTAGAQAGFSVDIWADTIAVGAWADGGLGAVVVYEYAGGGWTARFRDVSPQTTGGSDFGAWVSLWGDLLAVGSPSHDQPVLDNGRIFLYHRTGTSWSRQYEAIGIPGTSDSLGPVSCWGDTAVGGAYYDDDAATNAGIVYAYR